MQGLADMTRARDGLQRVPLMNGLGAAVFVNDITEDEIIDAVSRLELTAATHGTTSAAIAALPNLQHTGKSVALSGLATAIANHENNILPVPPGFVSLTTIDPSAEQCCGK